MGMSIDEAIEEVQQQKLDYQEFGEEYKNEHIEALDMAIDTMRKYQKIERIFKDWCEVGDDGDTCAFRDLKQVICPCIGDKDENVD